MGAKGSRRAGCVGHSFRKSLAIYFPQKVCKIFSDQNDNLRIAQDRYSRLVQSLVHEQNRSWSGRNKKPI